MGFTIAIDGPCGSGKSTIAKNIAEKLKFVYVDTGAMYRSIALYFLNSNINYNNLEEIYKNINNINLEVEYINKEQKIFLNKKDVTKEIRREDVGQVSSKIATYKIIRDKLLNMQVNLAKNKNIVMDGRDIGTCVLPNANIKIYLTASIYARSIRRKQQLQLLGEDIDIDIIKKEIKKRDRRDIEREISPLKISDDAFYIDTSNMKENEVLEYILEIVNLKLKNRGKIYGNNFS